MMNQQSYAIKLAVGDIFCEERQGIKRYKKVTAVGEQISKCTNKLNRTVYYYIKCDKKGLENPFQTGVCYADIVDDFLSES